MTQKETQNDSVDPVAMTGDANGHQNGADGKGGDAAPAAKKEPPSHDKKGAQKDGDTPSDHHQPAVRASKTIIDPDKARDFQVCSGLFN